MAHELSQEQIVKALVESTTEVFTTMLGTAVTAGPASVERSLPPSAEGVVALVGLAGPWIGTGGIGCSAELACKFCSLLLMTESSAVNDEVLDAVGELANMIVGSFKTRIEEHVGALGLSIPTVIYGRNFTARSLSNGDWIIVPFECEGSILQVEVCLAPNGGTTVGRPMAHTGSVFA
jgi:chemotaxis protein CheX